MGWQDWFTHGFDFIKYWIDHIYNELYPKFEEWAWWTEQRIFVAHDMLWHKWSEVKDIAVTAGAAAYELMLPKINEVRRYALGCADNAFEQARRHTDRLESTLRSTISNVDNKIDTTKRIMLASMENMESVAGAARAALVRTLESAIDSVEREAGKARNRIVNNLNKAIDVLEREAKEAREVVEGNLVYAIDSLERAVDRAMDTMQDRIDQALRLVSGRVSVVEGWVEGAAGWFGNEINKYKGRVIGWIVDAFEDILDRVFK